MKLTLKIKLLPDKQQAEFLLKTIKEANVACNTISKIAWDKRCFQQFKLHKEVYHILKSQSDLSAQIIVRCISKVSDAYKVDGKVMRHFRPLGAISYDARILTYRPDSTVSIWSVGGRIKIPFVCHRPDWIPYIKGEADLLYKKEKFFLLQTVEIPDEIIDDVEEFLGVDLGLTDIAVTSDGMKHAGEKINKYRENKQKIRSSIQSKGTRSSKRLLKRLSGREKTTATIINHTISKSIVDSAKSQGLGIAIEDLTNIRFTSKRRKKKNRTMLGRWSFYQLRQFLTYKSLRSGVPLVVVNPRYTSQMCNECLHIGKRTNKRFDCTNDKCKVGVLDADINAAKTIALLGATINNPERCNMFSCSVHH